MRIDIRNIVPKIKQYYGEVVQEVKKCSWPERSELVQHTALVITGIILLTTFVKVTDLVLEKVVVLGLFDKLPKLFG